MVASYCLEATPRFLAIFEKAREGNRRQQKAKESNKKQQKKT
jgi:hypothetical protein